MPKGIYIRTEEARKNISKAHKGQIPWNTGKHLSEKTKLKISETERGKKLSKETKEKMSKVRKGQIPWNKGKICPQISRANKGQTAWNKGLKLPQFSGVNGCNWKGGITPLQSQIRNNFKSRQWRSDIFTRDNFVCQDCGQKGGNLNAHHIKSFSSILQFYKITTLEEALECEELWNINNGVTLCKECHKKLHKRMIKTNETNSKIS